MFSASKINARKSDELGIRLELGKGIMRDIEVWSDRFEARQEKVSRSANTMRSYAFFIKSMREYISRYYMNAKGIGEIDVHFLDSYLDYVESYAINSKYGTIIERVESLEGFAQRYQAIDSYAEYLEKGLEYLHGLEDEMSIDRFAYVHADFGDYYAEFPRIISDIDQDYIVDYIAQLPKAGITTMIQRRALLHKFLSFIDDELGSNHFTLLLKKMKEYRKPKGDVVERDYFTPKQADVIAEFLFAYPRDPAKYLKRVRSESQQIAYRDTALVLLMMGAGMRASETIALTFDRIKPTGKGTYKITVVGGKGNKNRTTYIPAALFDEHYGYLLSVSGSKDEQLALRPDKKRAISRDVLYQKVRSMFEIMDPTGEHDLYGRKGLHVFRHYFGRNFAEKNGNMRLLQDLLGHYSSNTTMLYSNVGEDAKEGAVAGL